MQKEVLLVMMTTDEEVKLLNLDDAPGHELNVSSIF